MQSAVIFLGAGKPFQGDEHAALRSASGHTRVIDWLLHATTSRTSDVHFVGGYKVDSIKARILTHEEDTTVVHSRPPKKMATRR